MHASPYPEASAHGGQLVHRSGIPVLRTSGTAEQIGLQVGTLAMPYARQLYRYPLDYLRSKMRIPLLPHVLWMLLQRKCRQLFAQLPDEDRAEAFAIAKACPDRGQLVPGNTLFDMTNMGLRPLFGCSTFAVPAARSTTGHALLGRNLDFEPLDYLYKYSLVQIIRRTGTLLAFANVVFPGFVGCFSGMNEAGLSVVRHEVIAPKVPRAYVSHGVPFGPALRRVMERCRTVQEAIAELSPVPHASVSIVIVADAQDSAILEVTPDGVFVRPTPSGMLGCANHFLHPSLQNDAQPNEYRTLNRQATLNTLADTPEAKLGVAEIWAALHQVHQDSLTLQTMAFEPATRTLHVAFGPGPTTGLPPQTIALDEFWNA